MINVYAMALTGVLVLLDLALVFYVLPKNIKEVKRNRDSYGILRWAMLNVTLSMILFTIIPIAYQLTRLDIPTGSIDLFRALSSISWVLLILSVMIGWVSIHAISDILIHKDKRKK